MELLSNHTTIARGLRRAPLFGDMNPDTPAYEINGHGFHFTDSYMSKDIKRVSLLYRIVVRCSDTWLTIDFIVFKNIL